MVGVVLTTGVCTVVAGSMSVGKFTLFGLAMMTVLVGLVYVILYQAELSGLYRFMSLVFLAVLALSLLQSGSGESGRASGTMGDPNEWATIVLLMSAFLLGGLSDDRHILAPALRVGLLILVPLGILKSESRSALLVGLLLAPVCLYLVRQHKTELIGCAFAAMLGAPLFINQSSLERFGRLVDRFSGEPTLVDDSSLDERAELLAQGLDLFREHWLMGAGPGNFSRATGFISDDGRLRPAHNTWLEIASEQGIVGLIPVGIFLITVSRTFYKGFYTAGSETNRNRVLGAAAGLGAVALMAATLGLVTFAIAYLMLGIGMAVVAQSRNHYAA
jgi:O-antigen ligase